jgi:antitoxin component of MazEF toxin-antitoxin module
MNLKVRKVGESLYIKLPKPFCVENDIEWGDPVSMAASNNVVTLVFPPVIREIGATPVNKGK